MVNNIVMQGRLTRDVDVRYTNSNVAVGNFGLAVERDFKGANGEREADFFEVIVWRATADFCRKYFRKGDMIILTGRAQTRTYTDKDGANRKVFEIVAETVNFCGGKNDLSTAKIDAQAAQSGVKFQEIEADDEDGLPF